MGNEWISFCWISIVFALLTKTLNELERLVFVVEFPKALSSRPRAAKETNDVMFSKVIAAFNRINTIELNVTAATTFRNVKRAKSPKSAVSYKYQRLHPIAINCSVPKKSVRCFKCEVMKHVTAKCTKRRNEEENRRCWVLLCFISFSFFK